MVRNRVLEEVPVQKPVALIMLSGGGFTGETKDLLASIRSDFAFSYLASPWGGRPGEDGIPHGPFRGVPAFGSFTRPSRKKSAYAFVATFFTACGVLRRSRIDLVVGVGSSHAAPLLLAGRLFRKETVFIESLTRVDRLSRTGALIYRLHLARTFIVQWPALQELYPRSRLGSLL